MFELNGLVDGIEKLRAENDKLRAENERLHRFVDEVDKLFEDVKRERVGKQ